MAKLAPGQKLPIQYRSFEIDRAKVDEKARTMELSFASEYPVERWFGKEVLKVSRDAVDLSRLNPGGALLINHDSDLLVGTVVQARVDEDRVARASVKFGRSPKAEEEFQNVLDGIRTKVSFGYRVNKMVKESEEEGVETFRVTSFTPYEISLVSVPADPSVGIGREHTTEEFDLEIEGMKRSILLDPDPPTAAAGAPPAAPPVQSRAEVRAEASAIEVAKKRARLDEQTRIREINSIVERINHPDVADMQETAISEGWSLDQFREKVLLTDAFRARPVQTSETGLLGMSDKEIGEYSIVRAILRKGQGLQLDGIEREASDALAKKINREPKGFFIPMDVAVRGFADSKRLGKAQQQEVQSQVRALVSNVHGAGGALVFTDSAGASLIELLRNQMFVMQMGARNLTGLVGDVAIPRQTGGATAYWLGQGATVSRTQQVVDQLGLTPHRLAACTAYDKQLLVQSSISVEAFVREDITTILAIEKDRVAINGAGTAGEPQGILQTSGLSTSVTLSAAQAPIFTDIIRFETNLAVSNADRGRLGYLCTPTVRGNAKGTPKFTSTGTPIWENDSMNGYPARATNQVPTATSTIFGRWDDLIIADWDGMDVVVDPYSLVRDGQIQVVIQMLTDVGLRHAKSFSVSTN